MDSLSPRLSVEVFVPRSEDGVRTLCEPLLREMAGRGPAFVGLSGYELGGEGEGAEVAACIQAQGLRLQLHLECAGTTRARAAWFVDECARAGVRDVLLLAGEAKAVPDGFGSVLELLRFLKERAGGALRCAVAGYPRGSAGPLGDYVKDLEQLKQQLQAGADCVMCQPVYDAQAVQGLASDLGDALRGATLLPTLLPIQSKTGFTRLVHGLGLSPPAWLLAQIDAAQSDEAAHKVWIDLLFTSIIMHIDRWTSGYSKAFALIWYRSLTWCFLCLSSPRPAHACRALESCRHAGKGLPCCPVTSSGSSGAANGRAGEEYQVKARYQVRANPLIRRLLCI